MEPSSILMAALQLLGKKDVGAFLKANGVEATAAALTLTMKGLSAKERLALLKKGIKVTRTFNLGAIGKKEVQINLG